MQNVHTQTGPDLVIARKSESGESPSAQLRREACTRKENGNEDYDRHPLFKQSTTAMRLTSRQSFLNTYGALENVDGFKMKKWRLLTALRGQHVYQAEETPTWPELSVEMLE